MAATFSQGSRSQLAFKAQTAFLTQATGNYTRARFSTHSLDYQKATIESDEIRADRQVQDFRHSQGNAMGDVAVPLIYSDHNWLLESALFSTFSGNDLSVGTTPQYYSMEDQALDINLYKMFVGMTVSKASLEVKPGAIIKLNSSFIGSSMATAGGSSAGTLVSPSNNQPFDSFNAGVYMDTVASGSKLTNVSALTLNIDNGVAPTEQVGYQSPQNLTFGRERVTGTLTLFSTDRLFIDYFLNETESALTFQLIDPSANSFTFKMPRIKYNGASNPVQNEQSRFITLPFVALKPSSGNELTITKS